MIFLEQIIYLGLASWAMFNTYNTFQILETNYTQFNQHMNLYVTHFFPPLIQNRKKNEISVLNGWLTEIFWEKLCFSI